MSEATSIATIFEDFGIDHTPDGWLAVQQKQLTEAALMLRRLQTSEDELVTALGECWDAMPPSAIAIGKAIGFPTSVPAYVRESVSLLTAQRDELLVALKDAATSLETISILSGRKTFPIETYMEDFMQVRGYANSRMTVARASIAKAEGGAT